MTTAFPQGVFAVIDNAHFMAFRLEIEAQARRDVGLVLDDKQRRHWLSGFRRRRRQLE